MTHAHTKMRILVNKKAYMVNGNTYTSKRDKNEIERMNKTKNRLRRKLKQKRMKNKKNVKTVKIEFTSPALLKYFLEKLQE